jgi:AcrR family transcriptional regulator
MVHASDITALEPTRRKLDPERTRQNILAAAYDEFAENGLNGARVDAIAARTNTVKRMIYYYFGSKEGLYLAVLEQAYSAIRTAEEALALECLPPETAIRRMVEHTFDYHDSHPGFSRLVTIENIQMGRFIAQSRTIRAINLTVVEALRTILERGQAEGVFRTDIDPIDVHMMISALAFFRVANRHTFGLLFNRDMSEPALRAHHRSLVVETVLRSLRHTGG